MAYSGEIGKKSSVPSPDALHITFFLKWILKRVSYSSWIGCTFFSSFRAFKAQKAWSSIDSPQKVPNLGWLLVSRAIATRQEVPFPTICTLSTIGVEPSKAQYALAHELKEVGPLSELNEESVPLSMADSIQTHSYAFYGYFDGFLPCVSAEREFGFTQFF